MIVRLFGLFERPLLVLLVVLALVSVQPVIQATPFGEGVFGADVPFGSLTSLAINLGGNVSLALSPNGTTFTGNGSHTITVTSTDAVGYGLYVYSPGSTNMVSGSSVIPASLNGIAAPLATNTWGYNATGSTTNYLGMTTTPTMLKKAIGPYKNGDATTVNYGVLTDITKGAGAYNVSVVYTAVALNN